MPDIPGGYLKYAKGESGRVSVWSLLNIAGIITGPYAAVRNAFYDRGIFCCMDPPVPVISVGSLCRGETGKTAMAGMLARKLSDYGLSAGIVCRGRAREPFMLANPLPDVKAAVSRDMYEGARFLKDSGVEVVVADDAFQHRRMGRDINIVMVDASCPFGNGKLFPAGILREKPDALSRADIVILTGTEPAGSEIDGIKSKLARWVSPDAIFTARVEAESNPPNIPLKNIVIDDEAGFWRAVTRRLKPELVVASNGHGEDAMGSLLAVKLKDRFPEAEVSAFALVGGGREYKDRGIKVISPESETPSGGLIMYSPKALLEDIKYGLRKVIKKQIEEWRKQSGRFRTPICVGDVYLLANTLWGQGMSPVLVATAKTNKLKSHLMPERALMKRRARRVWTRDDETARDLAHSGIDAVFRGNPLMDIAEELNDGSDPWEGIPAPRVMLLPGSRRRAYQDGRMILDAVKLISEKMSCGFVMVVAPTLDTQALISESNYPFSDGVFKAGSANVAVYEGPAVHVARKADLLIGFGGTANQFSAGLGVPIVCMLEHEKLLQKKLLGDSLVLTQYNAQALAERAVELLNDPAELGKMSRAGIKMMGGSGALPDVVDYTAGELGLDARCKLFAALRDIWLDTL